jgi:hypothetical protein
MPCDDGPPDPEGVHERRHVRREILRTIAPAGRSASPWPLCDRAKAWMELGRCRSTGSIYRQESVMPSG